MTNEVKQQTKSTEEQAERNVETEQVLNFLKQNTTSVSSVLIAIIAIALIVQFIKTNKAKTETKASIELMNASTPDMLREVTEKFKNTTTAPIAALSLAQKIFHKKDYDGAEALYKEVLNKQQNNDLNLIASFGIIACTESRGDFEAAAKDYASFAEKNRDSQLFPEALIGQARCLEQMGKLDDAKAIYEDLKVDNKASQWEQIIDSRLKLLSGKKG